MDRAARLTLRPFRPEDLDALYEISLATGHQGGDAAHLYEDPRLIGHIYSAPYGLLEPGLALVAADEEGVAGYAVGVIDTDRWDERLEAEWWPSLRRQYRDPGQPSRDWTMDQRRAWMIHHPYRTPAEITGPHPGHMHMNLQPRAQGRGVGSALLEAWFDLAGEGGARGVHVGVNAANPNGLRFWATRGFADLKLDPAVAGRTVWMGRD